jgi:heme/copper-type cytochrome/quinol oxidase subunit 3
MNIVQRLSSCYPERTTVTLLDQMDHPIGYTFRPANKTTYNSRISLSLAYSFVWRPGFILKKCCLFQLTIYICVCVKQTKNIDWNATHCYCYFRRNITGDLAKLRILNEIMLWQSSSAQLAAHSSSHTSDQLDLSHLVGRVFLNNITRTNRK